jgi:hypothetical protein
MNQNERFCWWRYQDDMTPGPASKGHIVRMGNPEFTLCGVRIPEDVEFESGDYSQESCRRCTSGALLY